MDVILGVHWLRTLGDCKMNWDTQEYSFFHQGQVVKLCGDHDQQFSRLSQLEIAPMFEDELKLELMQHSCQIEDTVKISCVVEQLLTSFAHIFVEPTCLPPWRGREHAINLLPGENAVSVRPYRYPHAQKEVMEKMVQDMLVAGTIRRSHSPYPSPVLLVKKKDQS